MNAQQLSKLISSTPDIQDEYVLSKACQGIVDYFASSLYARAESDVLQLKVWIEQEGGSAQSWLIGQQKIVTARQAALFNGFQAHYLDYDDVHEQVRGHPSAVVLSALFASINPLTQTFINGRRFLTAYVIGIELMARFGEQLNPAHYQQGWHSTGTLGGIAAVAAICYLHQYNFLPEALALAATQASGLRLMFGTPIKPLHAGIAAQAAIQSVEWLKAGLHADTDMLDSQIGFSAVYGKETPSLTFNDWGQSWRIVEPGLWFKTYSFCSAAATVANAAQTLAPSINLAQLDHIELLFNPQGDAALIYTKPSSQHEGRFSAEYIVAKLLLQESLDFAAFEVKPISETVRNLMAKMQRKYVKPQQLGIQNSRFGGICAHFTDGSQIEYYVAHPKGSPRNPYSDDELFQKLIIGINNRTLSQRFFSDIQGLKQGSNLIHFIQKYQEKL